MQRRISKRVESGPPSGIRKFFDIATTMQDVISLGIGEPDFVTPDVILSPRHCQTPARRDALHLQFGHGQAAPGHQRRSRDALRCPLRPGERDPGHGGRQRGAVSGDDRPARPGRRGDRAAAVLRGVYCQGNLCRR